MQTTSNGDHVVLTVLRCYNEKQSQLGLTRACQMDSQVGEYAGDVGA